MADRMIELVVSESGSGSGAVFGFHVRQDGGVVASNQGLTPAQSGSVRELSQRYGQLFEQRTVPQLARDGLAALGAELFALWLQPAWPTLRARLRPGEPRVLVVASDRAAVLNLPWELLRVDGGEALGADAGWSLRRVPWTDPPLAVGAATQRGGPLRVLYMVAAPRDQVELDFEREEERLLRAFGQAGPGVVFDSGDLGTFEELGQRIADFRPHVVHLTGHGVARDAQAGYFAFENERGETDERSAADLGQLFAGSEVQCAFLSACQAGRAPAREALGGLAQGLLSPDVSLPLAWRPASSCTSQRDRYKITSTDARNKPSAGP